MDEIYLEGDEMSGWGRRVIFVVLRFLKDVVLICVVPKLYVQC